MSDRSLRRAAAALAAAFAALTCAVALAGDVPGDRRASHALRTQAGAVERAAVLVDEGTGYRPVGVATALLVTVLVLRRRPGDGARAAVAVVGTLVGTTVVKRLVDRPRPALLSPLTEASAYSYPSGHAAGTAALALVLVLAAVGTRWRPVAVAAALALVVVAGAAQLVLARHYPSDLVGGVLWAGACTAAVWVRAVGRRARPDAGGPTGPAPSR